MPANCVFEVDDFESDWSFSKPFDFIYGRALAGSVRDVPALLNRAKSNLNPGGWVEMVDIVTAFFSDDGSHERAPNMLLWAKLHTEGGEKFGKVTNIAPTLKQSMIEAGFVNVREEVYKVWLALISSCT